MLISAPTFHSLKASAASRLGNLSTMVDKNSGADIHTQISLGACVIITQILVTLDSVDESILTSMLYQA